MIPGLFEILGANNLLSSDIAPATMAFQQQQKNVMSCKVCINSCNYLIAFGRTMFYGSSEMCFLYHCPSLKGTIITTGMVILVVLTTEIYIIFIDSRYVINLCHTQQMRLWVGTGKVVCLTFTFRQLQNYYFFMKSTAAFVYIVMFEMYEYHHSFKKFSQTLEFILDIILLLFKWS